MTDVEKIYSSRALGEAIRRYRLERELTQEKLGSRAGYKAGPGVAVSRIESGKTRVGPERLRQLAEALDVPADSLISEACEATPDNDQSDPGPASAGTASKTTGAPELSKVDGRPLQKRQERVRRRIQERQGVLDRLGGSLDKHHAESDADFVLPFIEIAREIDGSPRVVLSAGPEPDGDTRDWQALNLIRLARVDVSELLSLAAPISAVTGQAAQLAAMRTAIRFGNASTGTAIRALQGVAKTNAAQAFFGGGAEADGGFGMKGGSLVLRAIGLSPAILLALTGVVAYHRTKQHNLATAEAGLDKSQDRFDALVRMLNRSDDILRTIALFASRRFNKWKQTLPEQRPIAWTELTEAQQQSYDDFITLVACYLSVAALNPERLLDEDVPLDHTAADVDAVLGEANRTVNLLV